MSEIKLDEFTSKVLYDPSYDIFYEMEKCVDFLKMKIQNRKVDYQSNGTSISWPLPKVVSVSLNAETQVDNSIPWPLPYVCA